MWKTLAWIWFWIELTTTETVFGLINSENIWSKQMILIKSHQLKQIKLKQQSKEIFQVF